MKRKVTWLLERLVAAEEALRELPQVAPEFWALYKEDPAHTHFSWDWEWSRGWTEEQKEMDRYEFEAYLFTALWMEEVAVLHQLQQYGFDCETIQKLKKIYLDGNLA